MQQLDQHNLELSQAAENLRNSRKANKAYFDIHNHLRPESGEQQLHVGDLVLLHRSQVRKRRATKLDDHWSGPYRIREIEPNSTFYRLEELDGTPLAATFAGNRLKKFFTRDLLRYDRELQDEYLTHRRDVIRERQTRAANPDRLRELMDMVDNAKRGQGPPEVQNSADGGSTEDADDVG